MFYLCNWDYLFWKHKLLLLLFTHQTLGSAMFPPVTLQLGLSLLETQASFFLLFTHQALGSAMFPPVTLQLGLSLLETQASSLIVYTPSPGVCYVSPMCLCNWDHLFWKHKLLLLLFTHQTLGSAMFPPVTLQLGLSLLETQASSLIVYTLNPGVCYVPPCDFATGTISSGNTSFFSYCLHTKPWGLLCFPPCAFATGTISSGTTSFFSYCLHTKPWGLLCSPL
jgi:hypothetical protein